MPQDITVLVNECVAISDDRKPAYLLALREVLEARILTVDNLNAFQSLWANNSDSIYAFCELVKRIGSQSENVFLEHVAYSVELLQLNQSQIHVFLLLHLFWLPADRSPLQRSALALFHSDPIFFRPIIGNRQQDCLIDIQELTPFSPEKLHEQGVRIDKTGMVFFSKESIAQLNQIARPIKRPTVNASVVELSDQNCDINLIKRFIAFCKLCSQKEKMYVKTLNECIEMMRDAHALPVQFANTPLFEMKKALLPVHYHAEIDEEVREENVKLRMRVSNQLKPLQVEPNEFSQDVLALLMRLNSPLLTPFIVHFAKSGFDFARFNYFKNTLREKLNIDWLSQQCLDFLMQLSPRELTDRAIDFFGATLKTDEKSTALALQARFQFVLWFGEASLENDDRRLLSVLRRFSSSAADPYLRPAMLKWIRDHGNIFSPSLTINLLVSVFPEVYPNHPDLLSIVRETANQINLTLWKTLMRQPGSREDHVAILSLCKVALSRDGRDQITDWVFKLNAANEETFVNALIDELFDYRLLTTKELADLYFDSRFTNQFGCIKVYFSLQKTTFLSRVSRILLNEGVQQSAQESTADHLQDCETRMMKRLQNKLNAYRVNKLIAVEESGVTSYQPQGVLYGVALFARASTCNAAKAFNQLNNKMQLGVAAIIPLIRDAEFKKQAGAFWETCCQDFANAFSVYETQLHDLTQQPDRLATFFFSTCRLNEYAFNYILQLCSPELKAAVEELMVVVRCGHGLSATVFDALLHQHCNSQHFQTAFPVSLPLSVCYLKPSNAQLPNINPIDQCKMTAEQLYQYEECEILSGELALRSEFQDRIINVPENVRLIELDLSQPVFFHQIAPSDELGMRDPFSVRADDQRRFQFTQERLRSALARYDVAAHQKSILFFGVINTANHYVPYVITKSKNGRVFVFTADPSAQSTLVGTVEFKKGQGVCPVGDKENLKRTMRRFFMHTFPGCVYEDIYVTQMLRERDCGPISLFLLREILSNNVMTIFDDHVFFDRNRITVQTAPCYSSGIEYYYPSDFELVSRRARAYWHAVFTSDEPFNYKEALKSDCFEVDIKIPNEDTYYERALNQFKRDQRQQHQSELCLFLHHPTQTFESLKQKLHQQGQLPTLNEIRVFIRALNDEINQSAQPDIKQSWTILYDTYFQNGDLNSDALIEDIRNIVIYNLKEPIQAAIKQNFKHYFSTYSYLLDCNHVAYFVNDFKQKESELFSCCDVDDIEKLEGILIELTREKIVEDYISRVVLSFDDAMIFNMLIAGRAEVDRIVRHHVDSEILGNSFHALYPIVVYLDRASKIEVLLHLINEKVEAALGRFVNLAYSAVKKRFNELLENPAHHARLQILRVTELVHWLLPDNTAGIILGKDAQNSVFFNLVFSKLVERTQTEFSSWIGKLSKKRVTILFSSEKIKDHFNSLSLDQIGRYLIPGDADELSVTNVNLILNQISDNAELYEFKQFYASFKDECEVYIRRALLNSVVARCEQLFELIAQSMTTVISKQYFYQAMDYDPADKNSFVFIFTFLDEESKKLLLQDAVPNLLGQKFIAYLKKQPKFLFNLTHVLKKYRLIQCKMTIMETIFKNAITMLKEGGYKGRRDNVVQQLEIALAHIKAVCANWLDLNRYRVNSVIPPMQFLEQQLLEKIRLVSSDLMSLLRPGNCDPVSTTQVIRVMLCQLLNIDLSFQHRVLTEVTAKQIDDAIVRAHATLLLKTLDQLVATETRLIIVTPNQSQALPKLSDCPNGLIELVARSIAWWRMHHHGISAVTHPTLFRQRVMAPGGLSVELLSLIDIVNTRVDIQSALSEYVSSNYPVIIVKKLTNTEKVIKNISDALQAFERMEHAIPVL